MHAFTSQTVFVTLTLCLALNAPVRDWLSKLSMYSLVLDGKEVVADRSLQSIWRQSEHDLFVSASVCLAN